jgi:hypothetical protein
LLRNRVYEPASYSRWSEPPFANSFARRWLVLLASLCVVAPPAAYSQQRETSAETAALEAPTPEGMTTLLAPTRMVTAAPDVPETAVDSSAGANPETMIDAGVPADTNKPVKPPEETEIIAEGLVSYGNYQIFAAGTDCKLYTAGSNTIAIPGGASWDHSLWPAVEWYRATAPGFLGIVGRVCGWI